MRILQVTGSFPPEMCGIGDYTARLSEALKLQGVDVAILTRENCRATGLDEPEVIAMAREWRIGEVGRLFGRVCRYHPDIVHFQYPGLGYGFSLGPHLLAVRLSRGRSPLFLTLHEFGVSHFLRKVSIVPMVLTADEPVFTTAAERAAVVRRLGWLRPGLRRAAVIPIGSNLPDLAPVGGYDPKLFSFWGMFHRGKGLELLIEAFRHALACDPGLRLQLVGGARDKDLRYIEELKALAVRLGVADRVTAHFDRPGDEVVRLLQQGCAVALPFRDGATFRRGTLVAAVRLGIPIITTRGADTPSELVDGQNVLFAGSATEMAGQMLRLGVDPGLRAAISRGIAGLSPLFGWDQIAGEHIALYRRALSR